LLLFFEELELAAFREVLRLFPREELDLALVPLRPRLPAAFRPALLRPDFFVADLDPRTPTRLA
jgi:hypothetical protein